MKFIPYPLGACFGVRSLSLFTLLAVSPPAFLQAANGTWDGGGADANWTTLSNWSGDAAFPGATSGTTNTDTATFSSAIANTWGESGTPVLIDSATFNLGGITFGTSSVGNYTIGTTGGNALYLTGGGTIQILDTATNNPTETISAPLVITGTNATYTFNNGRNQITSKLVLNGGISAGDTGNASLNFYGKQSGSPNEANGAISDGAATSVSLNHQTGTWYYNGNNTYTGDTTINAGAARFTGDNSGGGNFTINSGATAYFTGTNSYTGSFTLTSGVSNAQVYLGASTATGSILGVTNISVNGGRFYIDNTAGNADRVNDNAAFTLYGTNAILQLTTNSSADTTETVGDITIGTGNANIVLANASNRITTLNASSLTRASGNGTAIINTRTLGIGSSNTGRIFLTTAPSGGDFVGAGGSPSATATGTKNLAIVPWLYGYDSAIGKFLTYDSANGLRYLDSNETQSSITVANVPSGGESGDNVQLTASESGITTKTINSLMLLPSAALSVTGAGAGNTLVISSGALANSNAQAATLSGFDSVTFGNGEAVVTVYHPSGSIQIDSAVAVTSAGGLTKTGSGLLILNGANTYSGATTINQGSVQLGTGGTTGDFGASSSITLNAGTTLNYDRTDSSGIGSVGGGGSITLAQATGSLTINQTGSGNVINNISGTAGSTLVLAGTGETTISSKLATDDLNIKVSSGTVNLAASRQTASNLEITGGVVNTTDGQFAMRRSTAGTQYLTISGGELNVHNTFGLKGLNNDNNSNPNGTSFIGTQTGGIFSVAGTGSDDFSLGNDTAGGSSTYSLSGGLLSYTGTSSFILSANTAGTTTTTFNLSGGTLQSKGTIKGRNGAGALQSFVWTGGVLATASYDATNLTSSAVTPVSASTNTLTNAGGTLAPGDIGTTGRTLITGNYAVTSADAALHIDIGGTSSSGSFQDATGAGRYDNVYINGANRIVDLAGKLYVNLIDGYNGTGSFAIINNTGSGGQINGTFNNLVTDALGGADRVVLDNGLSSYSVVYNPTNVTLNSFVASNAWAGFDGATWSEVTDWTAFSPQAAGHIAQFTTEASGGTVNLDANRTIGGITFDSPDAYTLSSGNGSALTLDNTGVSGPADSVVTVSQGSHALNVPVALANNLNVETTGGSSRLSIGGVISGTGKALAKSGTGTLVLTAANTYTGGTTISDGTLQLGDGGTTGSLSTTGAIVDNGNLTINRGNTVTQGVDFSSAAITGTGSLTLSGSGTTVLNAANTYAGGTTVSAGKLLVNNSTGSGTGSGALSIGASATLGGYGIIGGVTTISGTLSPGNSPGILTFTDAVTLESGSFTTIEINGSATRGTDFDGVNFNGGLTVNGGTLTFNISTAIADGSMLNIFDGAALPATFTSVVASGTGGYNDTLVYNGSSAYEAVFGSQVVSLNLVNGTLSFANPSIPEPATGSALAGLAGLLFVFASRHSRRSLRAPSR